MLSTTETYYATNNSKNEVVIGSSTVNTTEKPSGLRRIDRFYSMSKPVADVAMEIFNFSRKSSLESYSGKSNRLKQVLKR